MTKQLYGGRRISRKVTLPKKFRRPRGGSEELALPSRGLRSQLKMPYIGFVVFFIIVMVLNIFGKVAFKLFLLLPVFGFG